MKISTALRASVQRAALVAVIGLGMAAQLAVAAPGIEATHKVAHGGIYELVYNPATNSVLVAAAGSRGAENPGRVVELDGDTLELKKEYDVSEDPFYGLVLNTRTQILYGTATRTGKVGALDLSSGEIVAAMGGDNAHVRQLAVDETSNRVYVSVVGTRNPNAENPSPSELWEIDGNNFSIIRKMELPGVLTGLALNTRANRAYMTDMNANQVVVIDLATGTVHNNWPTGGESSINVTFDADSERLFVTNQGSGTLSVMDARTGEAIRSIETGAGALAVLFSPELDQIYVTNRQAGTTSVIDADSYEVIANLATGTLPQSLAINTENGVVYASNKARGQPRNAPADAAPVVDENGDTVARIRP